MHQLSEKSAKQYYSILLDIHQWDIDFAIKVPIFKNLLEIGILNEVTGKNHFEDKYENNKVKETGQKTYLIDNKELLDRFGDKIKGNVRKDLFTGINDLFAKRNTAEHVKKINFAAYIGTLNTITEAVRDFSKIPIPDKLISILDGESEPPELPKKSSKSKKNTNKNIKLGENESRNLINKKLSLNLNRNNSRYSGINAGVSQWSFTIDNSCFNNDLYIILEDQNDKKIYCFLLKKGTINNPENIFNQRNDAHRKNASIIIIPTNDKNFTNNWQKKDFQFIKYIILKMNYQIK
jgi:hypothetical protein